MIHQMFLFVRDWSKRSVNEYPSAEEVLRAPPPPLPELFIAPGFPRAH